MRITAGRAEARGLQRINFADGVQTGPHNCGY